MKVLITCREDIPNPIISSYMKGLSNYTEVTCDVFPFWNSEETFDIIHIHWPEVLIYDKKYNTDFLFELKERFSYWKGRGTKIVVTLHNLQGHTSNNLHKELYEIIFLQADVIIHLGNFSKHLFENNPKYKNIKQVTINHPNYLELPNIIGKTEARQRLRLKDSDIVFLSFGFIRHEEEERLITTAFNELNIKQKKLIYTNSLFERKKPGKKRPLDRLLYEIKKRRWSRRGIVIDANTIDNNILQVYMNAADVLISPRTKNLNSGVIFLGYSFKKIVIAPAIGNIQEFQKKLKNPTFNPKDYHSLTKAMKNSVLLLDSNIEEENYIFAKNECSTDLIGKQHFELYNNLIAQK